MGYSESRPIREKAEKLMLAICLAALPATAKPRGTAGDRRYGKGRFPQKGVACMHPIWNYG